MDWTGAASMVQQLGFPAALCLGFLLAFYKLGKLLITFLTRVHESHEKERMTWYEGAQKSLQTFMQYHREEHIQMMAVLKAIQNDIEKSHT